MCEHGNVAIVAVGDGRALVVAVRGDKLEAGEALRQVQVLGDFFASQLVALSGTDRRDAVELARLASPYAVDNLEGISVTTGTRGETLLWIISDDNFNPMQRNILLLFELVP